MTTNDHKNGNRFYHSENSKYILDGSEEISIREFESRYRSGKGDKNAEYCVPNFHPNLIKIKIKGGKEYSGTSFTSVCKEMGSGEGVAVPSGLKNGNQANAGHFIEFFKKIFGSDLMDESYISAKINFSKSPSKKMEESDIKNLKGNVLDNPEKVIKSIEKNINIIVEGVAGSGKSHLLESLRRAYYKQEGNSKVTYWVAPEKSKKDSEEEIKRKEREVENKRNEGFSPLYGENGSQLEVVVFHPSTSYEEFVSGIRPNFMKKEGEGEFVSQEGTFVQMCNWAALNPNHKFLIFIDEINRANTSRVFGDLMLVLEKSKRQEFKDLVEDGRDGALFEASVQKMPGDYVRLQTPVFKNGKEYNKLAVPTNLHVLGTMNTTDRSVGTIDLALRRRFHWITQEPMNDRDELLTALKLSGDKEKSVGLVVDWFMHANTVLKTEVGPDARLGHAYFFGENGDVEVIAAALLNQLKEIAFTFNIDEKVLWGRKGQEGNADYWQNNKDKKSIGAIKVENNYWAIRYEGKGLGRRPEIVKDVSIAKAESNGIGDQGEEAADDTNN